MGKFNINDLWMSYSKACDFLMIKENIYFWWCSKTLDKLSYRSLWYFYASFINRLQFNPSTLSKDFITRNTSTWTFLNNFIACCSYRWKYISHWRRIPHWEIFTCLMNFQWSRNSSNISIKSKRCLDWWNWENIDNLISTHFERSNSMNICL